MKNYVGWWLVRLTIDRDAWSRYCDMDMYRYVILKVLQTRVWYCVARLSRPECDIHLRIYWLPLCKTSFSRVKLRARGIRETHTSGRVASKKSRDTSGLCMQAHYTASAHLTRPGDGAMGQKPRPGRQNPIPSKDAQVIE